MQWIENKFTRALGISIILALGMISIVFGAIHLFAAREISVPLPVLLMAFAVVFVLGSVFFEERGADRIGALIGGGVTAMVLSLVLILICGGVLHLLTQGMETGIDRIVSMLAVCMVIGMAAFNYLRAYR
ncbi:MAG: heat-shock protein [Euryarchaeota archaeon]|nr:heat-shock protein [Euryarchaeota archaeon]